VAIAESPGFIQPPTVLVIGNVAAHPAAQFIELVLPQEKT
jgi:hypothetical protein